MKVSIYADGACKGNPGPGGYGYLIISDTEVYEGGGSVSDTTNNRMEMTAFINAVEQSVNKFGENNLEIEAYLDSNYVINGCKSWIINWEKNKWKNSNNKPVLNKDLWLKILDLLKNHKIVFYYVKAHNGHIYNERVDQIASDNALKKNIVYFNGRKEGYILK